jgi:hypothetical protein
MTDNAFTAAKPVFRRAAMIIALLGAVQLGYSVWLHHYLQGAAPYQFGFLFLALILAFAGLRVASAVRWLCLLGAPLLTMAMLGEPVIFPADMLVARFRVSPLLALIELAGGLAAIAILVWLARELDRPEVRAAREAAGRKARDARIPMVAGTLLGIGTMAILSLFLRGETAQEAVGHAKARYGDRYHYAVQQLSWQSGPDGKRIRARIILWNDREYGTVTISGKPT